MLKTLELRRVAVLTEQNIEKKNISFFISILKPVLALHMK